MSPLAASTMQEQAATAVDKQDWHHTIDISTRRTVLLHILVLLKTKYGKVDAKISYIGRRAELALYSQAFSAWEYWNPQTLSRRLHSLVVKLHLNNLTEKEEAAFTKDQQARSLEAGLAATHITSSAESAPDSATPLRTKRKSDASIEDAALVKRRRTVSSELDALATAERNTPEQSAVFFDGNADLLEHMCAFLDTKDLMRCAVTCTAARQQFPAFVTKIQVSVKALQLLSAGERARMLGRVGNLESFTLNGQAEAQRFDFQDDSALVARNVLVRSVLQSLSEAKLPKLRALGLNYCYSEGLQDQITRQVADTLVGPASRFPRLKVLSLAGNCISDDGATYLYDALMLPRQSSSSSPSSPLAVLGLLNLEQNFIGERGHLLMQELAGHFALNGSSLLVNLRGNLVAPAAAAAAAASESLS